ncbi:MAG: helix-turn-helix transcriptional regulator [Elusimicrobia bacterium]|nr:helix-turn-helix transcriptional regulator [Elusimicrobiota bacterium]
MASLPYFLRALETKRWTRAVARKFGALTESLTPREIDVLSRIGKGLSSRDIATDLGIGLRTVESHREHIMQKLELRGAAALTPFRDRRGDRPSLGPPGKPR